MTERIVLGTPDEELRALQVLSLTLSLLSGRMSQRYPEDCENRVVPPLVSAAAQSLMLWSVAGLDTPLEILALSTRNVFELWLRLVHVLDLPENCKQWRDENLTDQLQVYEAILSLPGPIAAKDTIRGEIDRLAALAAAKGINRARRPLQVRELAVGTEYREEYEAFYKLYSKLVHPSSWFVNSPSAAGAPLYRHTLAVNSQVYAWRILAKIQEHFDVSIEQIHRAAEREVSDGRKAYGWSDSRGSWS